MKPGLLGERDEVGGREPAHLGMVPAQQRLEARDRAILQPHDRLVQHRHLVAFERAAQIGLHREAVALARAHRGLEHLDAIAADALAVIHRKLGILQHVFLALRRAVGEREPDRGGEQDLAVVEGDRRAQRTCGWCRRTR